jgi:hypothetical protein
MKLNDKKSDNKNKHPKQIINDSSKASNEIFHSGKYSSTVVMQDFFRKRK